MKPSSQLSVALLAATLSAWSPASQAVALTLSTDAPVLTGLTGTVSENIFTITYTDWYTSQVSNTVTEERVQIAPTATEPGLAYVYEVNTVTTTRSGFDYYGDFSSRTLSVDTNAPGAKFLTWAGTLRSGPDALAPMDVELSFSAAGTYIGGTGPFGATVPALVSFYFRASSADAWTALPFTFEAQDGRFSSVTGTASSGPFLIDLFLDTAVDFEFGLWASADVSLSTVGLNSIGDGYGGGPLAPEITVSSYETLVGAKVLSPVPEPGTWAMMLAGALALAWMGRRRSPRA